jgi:hypothetical protein
MQCVNFSCLLNWFLWVGIIGFGLLILFLTYHSVLVLGLNWCCHKFYLIFSIISHHHSLILGVHVGVANM